MKSKKVDTVKRIERGSITRAILGVLRDVGEMSEPLFMHNSRGMARLLGLESKNYHLEQYLCGRLKNLIDRGLLSRSRGKIILTDLGKKSLNLIKEKEKNKTKRRFWDKRWRLVMFDVYEDRRSIRNKFRHELKEYGFIQLQRSVWIYPYECENFIQLLKADNNFGKNVRYGVLESLEGDASIRKKFNLIK